MKPKQSGQKRNNRINKTLFPLPIPRSRETIMGPGGFEPPTSRLSAGRSTRLSYGPSTLQIYKPTGLKLLHSNVIALRWVLLLIPKTQTG